MTTTASFRTAVLAALIGLAACTQAPLPQNGERRFFGTLELEVSSAGVTSLEPQALIDETKLTFTPSAVSVVDSTSARYINATFTVQNRTGAALKNLTLYAYNQAANNVGGTALKSITSFGGTALTNADAARSVKPAHGMTNALTVDNSRADFQAFDPGFVGGLEIAAREAGYIRTPDRLLEYGFVARNGTSRGIANNGSGTVTLGLRVPKSTPANEPYRFTMTFVVADEPQTRVTRSREESAANAASRATAITDRGNPTQVFLIGPDTETTTCTNCTVTRQQNAKTSTAPTNLYADPSSLAWALDTVKTGLVNPWSLKFAPDGSLLFTSRNSGQVTVSRMNVSTGDVTATYRASNTSVRAEGEGGVLGMELAPDFATSNKIFVCYSYYKNNQVADQNRRNRLSSFVISGGALTGEVVLFDNMLGWSNHNGCRVANGPDDKLYFTMGDAANYNADADGTGDPAGDGTGNGDNKAQVKTSLSGKVFRINYDGTIPDDNPFYNSLSGQYRAIWSYGHRNPQGLGFEPWTGTLWSTEHGPNVNDELNVIQAGKNYGWPLCTGTANPCGSYNGTDYKPAIAQYEPGGNNTIAISDLTFYTGFAFPEWRGNLLFVSLKTGRLYRLTLSGQTIAATQQVIDSPTGDPRYARFRDLAVGPDGFIYISTDEGTSSKIYRLRPQ
jgi:glucose/arabinose dehydrogenase